MSIPLSPDSSQMKVFLEVPQYIRWLVYHRLQALSIPCWCSPEGGLLVELNNDLATTQLCSVLQQHLSSRQELVNWLESCWRL